MGGKGVFVLSLWLQSGVIHKPKTLVSPKVEAVDFNCYLPRKKKAYPTTPGK
jgi:hypothetical protein